MSREEMSVWKGAEVILPYDCNQQMAETETKDVHIEISGVGNLTGDFRMEITTVLSMQFGSFNLRYHANYE